MTPEDNPTIPYGYCHCGCGHKTNLNQKTNSTLGLKRGEPRRYLVGHMSVKHRQCVALSGSPSNTYRSWDGMKQRCLNPRHTHFADYGGRGITICERWMSFEAFLEDMGERPDGMSLNRINNDLGYSKDNCEWATQTQQTNNQRNNRTFEVNGHRLTLSQISAIAGIKPGTMAARLQRMSLEQAMSMPLRKQKHATAG